MVLIKMAQYIISTLSNLPPLLNGSRGLLKPCWPFDWLSMSIFPGLFPMGGSKKRSNSLHHKSKPNFPKGRRGKKEEKINHMQTTGELTPVFLLILLGIWSRARRRRIRLGAFGLLFLGSVFAVLLSWFLLFLFRGGLSPAKMFQKHRWAKTIPMRGHVHAGSGTFTSPHLLVVFSPVETRFSPDALLDPVLSSASFLESFLKGSLLTWSTNQGFPSII